MSLDFPNLLNFINRPCVVYYFDSVLCPDINFNGPTF